MTIFSSPGIYASYPSNLCSPWYTWFCELGQPLLDINRFLDGSWEIIQYHKTPILPEETPFHTVLGTMYNVPITEGFIEKYISKLDNKNPKGEFWDREAKATKRVYDEQAALLEHQEDTARRMTAAVTQNPGLLARVLKNGITEMDPRKIFKHIPKYRL